MKCRNTMCYFTAPKNKRKCAFNSDVCVEKCKLRKKFNRVMSDWYKAQKYDMTTEMFHYKFKERIRED